MKKLPFIKNTISRSLAVLIPLLVMSQASDAALIDHWTFDTDLSDSAGTANLTATAATNAAAGGNTSSFQLGGGSLGGASNGLLDGLDDQAATAGNFSLSGTAARTLSAWFKAPADQGPQDNGPTIMGMGGTNSTAGQRFDIRLSASSGSINDPYDGYLRGEFQGGARMSTTNLNVNDNVWHNVFVTYSGGAGSTAAAVTMYLDGKAVTLGASSVALNTVAAPFMVGGSNYISDSVRNFYGLIDDVGVWNNSLTATDAAIVNGLGRIGDNNLAFAGDAATLFAGNVGDQATINGATWKKVSGLTGSLGDWQQSNGANGAGSYVVLDGAGNGIQVVPEPSSILLGAGGLLGLLALRRRRS